MLTKITSGFTREGRESEFFTCTVENGDNAYSTGDFLWFSCDGTECSISEHIFDYMDFSELSAIFDSDSVKKIAKKFLAC